MPRKILILNGSPRKNGNTQTLVDAFTRGAEQAGSTVTVFNLDSMNVHPCKGCLGGGREPSHPCVQRDDMDKIYPVYREADIIVFATPLYYWSVTGQFKTAFDRLFAVTECDPEYKAPAKQSVLLMAAGSQEFEEVTYWYDRLMTHLGWQSLGKILCGDVLYPGDSKGRSELIDAEKLGAAIADQGNR